MVCRGDAKQTFKNYCVGSDIVVFAFTLKTLKILNNHTIAFHVFHITGSVVKILAILKGPYESNN